MAPTEARRLMDAAKTGLRDPVWGTTLGWLHLSSKLTAAQFAAGNRWAEVAAEYSAACNGPRPPKSASLERGQGEALDPDSPDGLREARQHTKALVRYVGAAAILNAAGARARRAVADTCERGQMPEGVDSLRALKAGLDVLAVWWAGRASDQGGTRR